MQMHWTTTLPVSHCFKFLITCLIFTNLGTPTEPSEDTPKTSMFWVSVTVHREQIVN